MVYLCILHVGDILGACHLSQAIRSSWGQRIWKPSAVQLLKYAKLIWMVWTNKIFHKFTITRTINSVCPLAFYHHPGTFGQRDGWVQIHRQKRQLLWRPTTFRGGYNYTCTIVLGITWISMYDFHWNQLLCYRILLRKCVMFLENVCICTHTGNSMCENKTTYKLRMLCAFQLKWHILTGYW